MAPTINASHFGLDTANATRIEWADAEYKFHGVYTGGVKDGKPHGRGDFVQQNGNKHLIGEWVNGVKQGEFYRIYLNGWKWVGNYKNDRRNGVWVYHQGPGMTKHYAYSNGIRVSAPPGAHNDSLKVGGATLFG